MRTDKQAGFSLVEILVTVAIIGILVGLVLGISGVASKKSDESKTRAEMLKISNAIEQYRIVYGSVPSTIQVLTDPATRIDAEFKDLKSVDPWGSNYVYTNQSRYAYRLYSQGPNKNIATDNIENGSY